MIAAPWWGPRLRPQSRRIPADAEGNSFPGGAPLRLTVVNFRARVTVEGFHVTYSAGRKGCRTSGQPTARQFPTGWRRTSRRRPNERVVTFRRPPGRPRVLRAARRRPTSPHTGALMRLANAERRLTGGRRAPSCRSRRPRRTGTGLGSPTPRCGSSPTRGGVPNRRRADCGARRLEPGQASRPLRRQPAPERARFPVDGSDVRSDESGRFGRAGTLLLSGARGTTAPR
jgi:hypothetical protein